MKDRIFHLRYEYLVSIGAVAIALSGCAPDTSPRTSVQKTEVAPLPAKTEPSTPTFRRTHPTIEPTTTVPAPTNTPEPTPTPTKEELARIQYGENAIETKSKLHPDIVYFTIAEYRPEVAKSLTNVLLTHHNEVNIDIPLVLGVAEGGFGLRNNPDGEHNLGNIKNPQTGEMRDFTSIKLGMTALINLVRAYPEKYNAHSFEELMPIYAPPSAKERIPVGEKFLEGLREISHQYESGEITQDQIPEKIHELRVTLQLEFGNNWI